MSIRFIATLLSCLLVGAVAAQPATAAKPAAQSPSQIVLTRSKAVVDSLVANREAFRADRSKLNAFVLGELDTIFDSDYSARLVLARHSRTASDAQIAAFSRALTTNLLQRYGSALLEVTGSLDVQIRSETPLRDGKLMRVNSEIMRPGGAPVPIDYLFRDTGHGWKAFDVIVEGVSYVQTYRTQFDALLRTETLDAVTQRLAAGTLRAGE
ncbi:MAG: MlaC/ttg2D family ABC transporter substrate-binding protein [Pseudomarimonas sp.]